MARNFEGPSLVPPLHFFKVVLPSAMATKILKIPPEFAKNHLSELSGVVTLSNPAGSKWVVRLEKNRTGVWFGEDWFEFAEYHSICEGHFLVFEYQGNSTFQVRIFDITACEIDYPCTQHQTNNDNDDDTKDGTKRKCRLSLKRDVVPLRSNSAKRPSCSSASLVEEIEEVIDLTKSCNLDLSSRKKRHGTGKSGPALIKKRRFVNATDNDVIEVLETEEEEKIYVSRKDVTSRERVEKLKLKHPSFMVVLNRHYYVSSRVYIPAGFTGRYFKTSMKFINIQDPKQRNWRVNVSVDRSKYFWLTDGWNELFKANGLESGNICVFELIKMKRNVGLKLIVVES